MTWWFHLLVRRVDSLRGRCDVFERVLCSGAAVPYAERAAHHLLLGCSQRRLRGDNGCLTAYLCTVYYTMNGVIHRGFDLPAVFSTVACVWYCYGSRHRDSAPCGVSFSALGALFRWRKGNRMLAEIRLDPEEEFTESLTEQLFAQLRPRRDHVSGKTP